MSMRRRTATTWTVSMTRSLARSRSVSLVLPLAPQQPKSAIHYSLRRAQSSIPAIEYRVVSSDFGITSDTSHNSNPNKGYHHNQFVLESGNTNKGDGDADSCCSDNTSCSSSIAELFDVLDEPQRVSKEILRSVSISYQWLDLPLYEFELPARKEGTATNTVAVDQPGDNGGAAARQSAAGALPGPGLPIGRQGSVRFAYIHDCRTGMSLVTHVELKQAMDNLLHWTIQAPRNCCLSYRHDTSGEVATLPWPDLEAGGMDEIEEFVSTVNLVEGKPVFFPRYQRSPFQLESGLCSQASLSSQTSWPSQRSLPSQKSSSSHSFSPLPPLPPPTAMRS